MKALRRIVGGVATALRRAGRAVGDLCRFLCCTGCPVFLRYRACAGGSGAPCDDVPPEAFFCSTFATCEGFPIRGRAFHLSVPDGSGAGIDRCFVPVDDYEYSYNPTGDQRQIADYLQPDTIIVPAAYTGQEVTCIDGCDDELCPTEPRLIPAAWCNGPPPDGTGMPNGRTVYVCADLIPSCGVYEMWEGYCARLDPLTALPLSQVLVIDPDYYLRFTTAAERRGVDCCGCGLCAGGTRVIPARCPGGLSPATVTCCCPDPLVCDGSPVPGLYGGTHTAIWRLTETETDPNGFVIIREHWIEAFTSVSTTTCAETRDGFYRQRLTQNGVVVFDITNPFTSVPPPTCNPFSGNWVFEERGNVYGLTAWFPCTTGVFVTERFGCYYYEYDASWTYDNRPIGGNLFVRSAHLLKSVHIADGPNASQCQRRCLAPPDAPSDPAPGAGGEAPEGFAMPPTPKPMRDGCSKCGHKSKNHDAAKAIMEGL